jgi:plastocyanin
VRNHFAVARIRSVHFRESFRFVRVPLQALVALAFVAAEARAETAFVIVGGQELTFSPQTIDINAGDTVTFLNFGGVHNVVADDGSFRCAHGCDNDGHGGNGGATGQLWSVSVNFPNVGTVGYFCETPGAPGTGMFGTINVHGAAPPPPLTPDAVSVDNRWFFALLAVSLIACAAPWLRRARRTSRD